MKPKTLILNLLGIFCLLVAVLIGSLPFVISFLCGMLVLSRNLSHSIAFCSIFAITAVSSAYPDAFRFGTLQLRLHDSVTIFGSASFLPSLIWNLFAASVGVKAGNALRTGFRDAVLSPTETH